MSDQSPKSPRRKDERPVLVIETGTRPAVRRRGNAQLQAMVEDLMWRVEEAEEQLRLKDRAIDDLRSQAASMQKKISDEKAVAQPAPAEAGAGEDLREELEHLDLFPALQPGAHRPAHPAAQRKGAPRGARGPRDAKAHASRPAAPAERAGASAAGSCPAGGRRMRKARCLGILAHVCLSCRAVFLDARAVHQVARELPWMQHVERVLASAAAPPAARQPSAPPAP